MRRVLQRIISLMLVVVLVLGLNGNIVHAAKIEKVKLKVEFRQTDVRQTLEMINELRTGDNAWYWNSDNKTKTVCDDLQELVYDYELEEIAMQRAAELALSFSHTRPDGSRCFTAYTSVYNYGMKGENVAVGFSSAEDAFIALREDDEDYASQGHRRNMLEEGYRAVGLGHVYYNGVHFWAQEFSSVIGSTEETKAKEGKATITAKIDTAKLTEAKVTVEKKSVSVSLGDKLTLPKISGKVRMVTGFGGRCEVTVVSQWKIADSSVAKISKGKIVPKKVGVTKITTTALGKKITVKLTVKPKRPSVTRLSATANGFKVTWKKQTKQVTGYELQYATDKKFTDGESIVLKSYKTSSKSIKNLESAKVYYVRMRAYKKITVSGKKKNIYSSWSQIKTVTTN